LIYAIGDVHGCAYELRLLLNKLPLTPESTVVFLGDYIDRGAHSRDVIDTIIELRKQCKVVCLKGNHEAMFLNFLENPGTERAGLFIVNGGSATLASYADDHGNYEFPPEHINFFRELQLYYEDEHHFFVHAGVPNIPLKSIDAQKHGKKLMWIRGAFLKSEYDWGKVIVHGHTPVTAVDIRHNRINVDTGCVFMRKLSAVALPGQQVFSVPRQRVVKPVYLKDAASRRVAIRFQGTLPVLVEQDGQTYRFETIDYSEVGLYMRDIENRQGPVLQPNQPIRGRIGRDRIGSVLFKGVVVRTHVDDEGYHYAVKVDAMIPIEDARRKPQDDASDSP
jgi:serine/threonine protein phosphatase 1